MFDLEMLPARRGDCLWIEYGDPQAPHRVLIDGGLIATWREQLRPRIEALPVDQRRFDLLVITHIDLDHIAGILALLRDPPDGLVFDDIWFNGWPQIEDTGVLGPRQGEAVSWWLEHRGWHWNKKFDGAAVALDDGDEPVARALTGGMQLTLLSPTRARLGKLREVWKKKIEEAGLEPGAAGAEIEGVAHAEDVPLDIGILGDGLDIAQLANAPFMADRSAANGSSIAFLAEYDGRSALCAGDAFAGDVHRSVRRLLHDRGEPRLEIGALKLSHHGGRKNTSRELIESLGCRQYLFSTDGSVYRHPDNESVARVIVHGRAAGTPQLVFNHQSDRTDAWREHPDLTGTHSCELLLPDDESGIRIPVD